MRLGQQRVCSHFDVHNGPGTPLDRSKRPICTSSYEADA